MEKLIIFDLDSTLAKSKSVIDAVMATLLNKLLTFLKMAVISGGNWRQLKNQLLVSLAQNKHLQNLFLLPTCGTKFYRYHLNWQLLYSEDFTVLE